MLTVTGTAATGAALAAATVDIECASGTGSATTAADGTYTVTITNGTLPCLARATGGAIVLHSMAAGSGTSAVANITPATELAVASLAGRDPAAFYAAYDAAAVSLVTLAAISSAESTVVNFLKAAGVDMSALGDLLSGTLVAGTGGASGNAYDAALDTLGTKLSASGTTLSDLTGDLVAVTVAPIEGVGSAVALPAALLLQPAAANCSALRSATYRIVMPTPGASLAAQSGLATIAAGTLAITRPDGTSGTLVANGACRFTDTDATTGYSADLVVSKAGVLAARYTSGGVARVFLGFPEQAHAVAELAGNWNLAGMNKAGSVDAAVSGAATLSAAGQWSALLNCENDATWDVSTCAAVPDSVANLIGPWQVDGAGGFDAPDAGTGTVNTHVFAYQSGSGAMMLVSVSQTGFSVWTPAQAIVLPAVGTSTRSWNFDITAGLASGSSLYVSTNVVDTVDATSHTLTRTHGTEGSAVTRVETLTADDPRPGYLYRAPGTVTGSDGNPQTIQQFTLMRVLGMGVSAGPLSDLKLFELSVNEP